MHAIVRHATADDLLPINNIYNSYIVDRHTSFDEEPWSLAARHDWFAKRGRSGRYQVLVGEIRGEVVGFAASGRFRDKSAYDTSVETTVVLDEQHIGKGIGRALLGELLGRLRQEDVHRAYALIALPNAASVALHENLGFRTVGVLDEVGRKMDAYRSVQLMELQL